MENCKATASVADLAQEHPSDRQRDRNNRPDAKETDQAEDKEIRQIRADRFVTMKVGAEFPEEPGRALVGRMFRTIGIGLVD